MLIQGVQLDPEVPAVSCVCSSISQGLFKLAKANILLTDSLPEVTDKVDVLVERLENFFSLVPDALCK
jgi:hypothetical protein